MRAAAMILAGALCLFAQTSRDAYRNAYKEWRQMDPDLERDAAVAGAQLEPRARKAAAAAEQYEAARKAFLEQSGQPSARQFAWLETAPADPPAASARNALSIVEAESKAVQRNMDTFAGDPDPGIQRLRGMLQRESLALTALSNAIAEREKAGDIASAANRALEQTRVRALDEVRAVTTGWKDAVTETGRESAAWAEYYQLLVNGAQGITPAASETPPPTAAARPTEPAPRSGERVDSPKPSITPITPVPLVRYTGAWTFPLTNGLYHGPQPEFADLVVHEENGRANGTLFARFKPAPGVPDDPVVRFAFSGEFKSARTQVFQLETSDGANGTLELIPGPAFNLIEVNFQIDAKPGKLRQGNMVLVKK